MGYKPEWFDKQMNIDIVKGIERIEHYADDIFVGHNGREQVHYSYQMAVKGYY